MNVEMKRRYVIAIDSFKGSLTSRQANAAAASAIVDGDVRTVAVSDGGDGMLDAFADAMDARIEQASVHDLMMRRRTARFAVAPDGTAVIETAEAVGLTLVKTEERNPMRSTSYGVGELIAAAVRRGARKFIVGLGGTGTSDAGIGMLRALVDAFGKKSPSGGTVGGIDPVVADVLGGCTFTLASDVDNPLCGERGAAAVFGPQKGATPDMVRALDERARRFADFSARHYGRDCSSLPGAGAAGGLGYAFMQYLGAQMESGADMLLRLSGMERLLAEADVVLTGEGSADSQTLMGKLPSRLLSLARKHGVETWLVAGRVADREKLLSAGFSRLEQATPADMPLVEAMRPEIAAENVRLAVRRLVCGRPMANPQSDPK